jgi:hypothetical protein
MGKGKRGSGPGGGADTSSNNSSTSSSGGGGSGSAGSAGSDKSSGSSGSNGKSRGGEKDNNTAENVNVVESRGAGSERKDGPDGRISDGGGGGLVTTSKSDEKPSSSAAAPSSSRTTSPSRQRGVGSAAGAEVSGSVKLLAIVMQQNSQLQREIQRLHAEIDEVTKGVMKRGYLYKFRDREISFASKWGLRYFVLQGKTISYFVDDKELRPRRSFDLTGCIVKDEGPSKHGGHYHVFSIYYPVKYDSGAGSEEGDGECEQNLVGSLLLRLSSENRAEAAQWISLLRKACAKELRVPQYLSLPTTSNDFSTVLPRFDTQAVDKENKLQVQTEVGKTDDWTHSAIDEIEGLIENSHSGGLSNGYDSNDQTAQTTEGDSVSDIAKETLERVRSATYILQQSQSRLSLAANMGSSEGALPSGGARSNITLDSADSPRPFSPSLSDSGLKVSASGRSLHRMTDKSAPRKFNSDSKSEKANHNNNTDKKRRFPASKPIHVGSRFSPLSAESRPSEQNYRGFFNLGVIILVLSNLRMILDNLVKYGILIHIPGMDLLNYGYHHLMAYIFNPKSAPVLQQQSFLSQALQLQLEEVYVPLQCLASWSVSVLASFSIEYLAARNLVSESFCSFVYATLAILNIVLPCLWTYYGTTEQEHNAGLSMLYLLQSVILWMKLISYNHVNSDLRKLAHFMKQNTLKSSTSSGSLSPSLSKSSASKDVTDASQTAQYQFSSSHAEYSQLALIALQEVKDQQPPFLLYPQNVTLPNLLWFLFAPTLCYQLNYPRSASPKIRWDYVASIVLRMLLVGAFIIFCVEQYITPTLSQSLAALKSRNVVYIFMRLLKLSIPNTYVWLLGFYFYFHLWLNLLAELTRFGDRCFYKDW